jgi:hypothetical protein
MKRTISTKRLISRGLERAIRNVTSKEFSLREKFARREWILRDRIKAVRIKLSDATDTIRSYRAENKRLRRAVHYLETLNGVTPKQTAKVNKILGLPPHLVRTSDWHKVAVGGWDYPNPRPAVTDGRNIYLPIT